DIRPLAEFQMKCNSAGVHQAYCLGKSAAHLLFYIIDALFQFALRELDHVQSTLDDIDERIFDGNEKNLVERISIVRRDILSFRKTLKPQKIVLESLVRHGVAFFGARSQALFRDMLGEYSRVWDVLENHKETAESLHDTNESLLSTKSTETMRTLTIFAVITFPLTLFATLFAMDTVATPIRGNPYDFWIIAGIMLFVVLCMILYFKRKRWI
ncbi:MAG: hypothetical protein HY460_01375, partial [Parcubacteria group bacterium]|nr:hypothetical protein [Parcubacteria group bacterium]